MARREHRSRLTLDTGAVYDVLMTDAISIEDVLFMGVQMAGYERVRGEDKFSLPSREIRDFLVMSDVFGD